MAGQSRRRRVVFLLAVAFSGARIALGGPTAYVVDLHDLYRVDLSTANATLVGSTGDEYRGPATSSGGQMYGTDVVGRLLSINQSSGAGTVIGSTGRNDIEALHFSGATLLAGDFNAAVPADHDLPDQHDDGCHHQHRHRHQRRGRLRPRWRWLMRTPFCSRRTRTTSVTTTNRCGR